MSDEIADDHKFAFFLLTSKSSFSWSSMDRDASIFFLTSCSDCRWVSSLGVFHAVRDSIGIVLCRKCRNKERVQRRWVYFLHCLPSFVVCVGCSASAYFTWELKFCFLLLLLTFWIVWFVLNLGSAKLDHLDQILSFIYLCFLVELDWTFWLLLFKCFQFKYSMFFWERLIFFFPPFPQLTAWTTGCATLTSASSTASTLAGRMGSSSRATRSSSSPAGARARASPTPCVSCT